MDTDVPYMPSIKNLSGMLDKIQNAAVPDAFGVDFLTDMGFTSSNDRAILKVLKYLGMLDAAGRPQASYREFVDHTKARGVLAARLKTAYDDLFASDKTANTKTANELKGWFKTKTGVSDAVAEKMATTFKALATYADFSSAFATAQDTKEDKGDKETPEKDKEKKRGAGLLETGFGLTYRIEIHLPDTTNVDTYRSIFQALREELLS